MAVTEMPFGDSIERSLWNFNKATGKKVASDVGSWLTKTMSTATEPIFRREMGERYFPVTACGAGILLWALTGLASCLTGNLLGFICKLMGLYSLGNAVGSFVVPLLVAAGFCLYYWKVGRENSKRIAEFRAEGKTYHSRSRGLPRWQPAEEFQIKIGTGVGLLLLAPIMGIVFIVSMGMSAKLEAEQQAALRDRYLDMLDAQIETEMLHDALLGKCPPEITFLYKPLSETLKPELRENIAAAAVGKPVKIMAQMPKPAAEVSA